MLGSLIGVSGPSYLISDGDRFNSGKVGKEGTFEPRGIIIGLVGSRFERKDRMDSVLVLPPSRRSRQDPALSKIIQEFLGAETDSSAKFYVVMYKARMRITTDILLLEANSRAHEAGKTGHV